MNAPAAQNLYSRDVLRLAMALPHNDRLEMPDSSSTRRASVCGSEMSVDVGLSSGKVSAIAIRAKACALGQASAAILREHAIGLGRVEAAELRNAVDAALTGQGEMPGAWSALAYARDYPARHGAILLPLDTLAEAMA